MTLKEEKKFVKAVEERIAAYQDWCTEHQSIPIQPKPIRLEFEAKLIGPDDSSCHAVVTATVEENGFLKISTISRINCSSLGKEIE
jgi:hypothetical protein